MDLLPEEPVGRIMNTKSRVLARKEVKRHEGMKDPFWFGRWFTLMFKSI